MQQDFCETKVVDKLFKEVQLLIGGLGDIVKSIHGMHI